MHYEFNLVYPSASILKPVGLAVDLDDAGTWPTAIRDFAEHWADALRNTTRFACDLALPDHAEESFRSLIDHWPVRVYHSARLLDEEVWAIRHHGLFSLSEDLVTSRIRSACASGHLSTAERDALLSSSVFASGNITGRYGQVCAVAGRRIFDDDPPAIELLLCLWGGEAIYWAHESTALGERLRDLGKPAVVVVNLNFATSSRPPFFAPMLAKLFVGKILRLDRSYGDVYYYGSVMPQDIVDIWQPGHREYDRHHRLPQD